jgi:asparaginyl-tRNA synthetase
MTAHGTGRRNAITTLLKGASAGATVTVNGWVKTSRFGKNVSFVHLYDGSSTHTVQVVLTPEQAEANKARLGVGAAVQVTGTWSASQGGEQAFEIQATDVKIVGDCDPEAFPIQKKATSLENLRTIAHLRPRTNTFQSTFRVRNAVSWHIHRFFQERGFQWVHTPIITTNDAEGAGELFEVKVGDEPFFGKKTFLTCSGQLAVENFAQAFTDVYTFGPTFRAEHSHTARHAAEFWMIEPEIAFATLDDVIALAEDFIKDVCLKTIAQCPDDFEFFDKRIEPGNLARVKEALSKPFARITWHEAVDILSKVQGRTWEFPVGPGMSLQSEHERYLAEEHFKGPVFVTNYPSVQKAFYMREDDNGETVSATDLLVPGIGEIIGGSQREERLDVLERRIKQFGLPVEEYWWYLDLRRFGTTPHGGFGLGLERLIMWLTGMKNIRDVLPYPRTPGSAEF